MDQLLQTLLKTSMEKRREELKLSVVDFEKKMRKIVNGRVLFSNSYEAFVGNIFALNGYATGIDDTLYYREKMRPLIGNDSISYDVYIYVSSVDTVSQEVRFDMNRYADISELGLRFMEDLGMNLQHADKKNDLTNDWRMGVEIFLTLYIDLKTGWVNFFKLTKNVTVASSQLKKPYVKQEVWTMNSDLEGN